MRSLLTAVALVMSVPAVAADFHAIAGVTAVGIDDPVIRLNHAVRPSVAGYSHAIIPVSLPHGSEVTDIVCTMYDNDSGYVEAELKRVAMAPSSRSTFGETVAEALSLATVSTRRVRLVGSVIAGTEIIDNVNYTYHVRVTFGLVSVPPYLEFIGCTIRTR